MARDDQRAIEAIGAALEGSDRPLHRHLGIALLAPGRVATEAVRPARTRLSAQARGGGRRAGGARRAARRVRLAAVGSWPWRSRLRAARDRRSHARRASPPISAMGSTAGRPYIGLTRRASIGSPSSTARKGAPSTRSPKKACPFKAIAEVIGRRLNVPVVSQSPEEAARAFRLVRHVRRRRTAPPSSERTRSRLGWTPEQPGLIADIDHPAYFAR